MRGRMAAAGENACSTTPHQEVARIVEQTFGLLSAFFSSPHDEHLLA